MEGELLLYPLLEGSALLESQRIGLRDDWNNIDNVGELLENDNINWLQGVTGRLDEEEAAVDAGILDVSLSLGGELFAEVCRVLIFDILDDRVPAGQC